MIDCTRSQSMVDARRRAAGDSYVGARHHRRAQRNENGRRDRRARSSASSRTWSASTATDAARFDRCGRKATSMESRARPTCQSWAGSRSNRGSPKHRSRRAVRARIRIHADRQSPRRNRESDRDRSSPRALAQRTRRAALTLNRIGSLRSRRPRSAPNRRRANIQTSRPRDERRCGSSRIRATCRCVNCSGPGRDSGMKHSTLAFDLA